MTYSKTTWVNNTAPALNSTNLNKMETGIDEAHDSVENITTGHVHDGSDSRQIQASGVTNAPTGTIAATDVQAAVTELDTEKVNKSTFNAQTILAAVSDNTPVAVSVDPSRFIGRTSISDISELTSAAALTILNVESGADVTDDVNVASTIHGVAAKTTPVDADEVGLIDSAAANVLKKLTWTNIKATLKTYFDTLYIGNVSEDSTPQLGGDLDLVDHEILVDTTPGTDHTASGMKGIFTNGNGGSVAFGDVCYVALDGHLEFADADATTTMPGLYMALGTITAASSGEWLISGIARDDTWTWTIGPGAAGLIYVSLTGTTANTLTQTAPSASGDQVQVVGHALSATSMMFNPSPILDAIA